jgi:hypothetical protein
LPPKGIPSFRRWRRRCAPQRPCSSSDTSACRCMSDREVLPVDGARKEAAGVWLTWEQTVLVHGE